MPNKKKAPNNLITSHVKKGNHQIYVMRNLKPLPPSCMNCWLPRKLYRKYSWDIKILQVNILKVNREIKVYQLTLEGNQFHPLHATWRQEERPNIRPQCLINKGIGQWLPNGQNESKEIRRQNILWTHNNIYCHLCN
jgi:hypothetical protein